MSKPFVDIVKEKMAEVKKQRENDPQPVTGYKFPKDEKPAAPKTH